MNQKEEYLVKNTHYPYRTGNVWGFDYSSKSNLAIVGIDCGVLILNGENLSVIKFFKFNEFCYPEFLSFLRDGKSFLCLDTNKNLSLRSVDSKAHKIIRKVENKTFAMSYVDDNTALLCMDLENDKEQFKTEVNFLNIQTNQIEARLLLEPQYKSAYLTDNLLVCGSGEGDVDIYDVKSHQLLKTFEADFPVHNAKLSQDKRYVICAGVGKFISVFDFHTGNFVKTIETKGKHVLDFKLTADNHYLMVCELITHLTNKAALAYFSFDSQQCLSRVECGEFFKKICIDEVAQTLWAAATEGVNLIDYKTDEVPSLKNMCFKKLRQFPTLFPSDKITSKEKEVLCKYFYLEEESEKNQTAGTPKYS